MNRYNASIHYVQKKKKKTSTKDTILVEIVTFQSMFKW